MILKRLVSTLATHSNEILMVLSRCLPSIRLRPGVWEYLRVNVNALAVEESVGL
ncbi:putative sucrose synthase [Helianthus annuus]|uniref:Sucrose synthase n=1 Tax=Helianthus annuus TaxID=4232 RepID=A0A9K3NT33_HELAN|nr:putative sucrose synthase [Helianthus annuus]KAJ0589101.1 putative sucrose synthase [Helianthus annuus]KAJ0931517.1 putative sucrose synthase [Helianthus annuus]KAJ0931518.1 putative sucrose synthase [Helianthus annuus]